MAYSSANTGANIATGAGAGAAIGTSIMPGWGTAIGAGVGALAGVFQSIAQYSNDKERREKVEELSRKIGIDYNNLQREFDSWYSTHKSEFFDESAASDYKNAAENIRNFDSSKYDWLTQYGEDFAKYDFVDENGNPITVDTFVTPYLEDLQADAAAKLEHTAAGAGVGRGTGAARAIANSNADIKDKAYKTALQEFNSARNFDYQKWRDYTQSMRDRLANMMSADQWQIGQQKALGEDFINFETSNFENQQRIKQAGIDAKAQIELAGL